MSVDRRTTAIGDITVKLVDVKKTKFWSAKHEGQLQRYQKKPRVLASFDTSESSGSDSSNESWTEKTGDRRSSLKNVRHSNGTRVTQPVASARIIQPKPAGVSGLTQRFLQRRAHPPPSTSPEFSWSETEVICARETQKPLAPSPDGCQNASKVSTMYFYNSALKHNRRKSSSFDDVDKFGVKKLTTGAKTQSEVPKSRNDRSTDSKRDASADVTQVQPSRAQMSTISDNFDKFGVKKLTTGAKTQSEVPKSRMDRSTDSRRDASADVAQVQPSRAQMSTISDNFDKFGVKKLTTGAKTQSEVPKSRNDRSTDSKRDASADVTQVQPSRAQMSTISDNADKFGAKKLATVAKTQSVRSATPTGDGSEKSINRKAQNNEPAAPKRYGKHLTEARQALNEAVPREQDQQARARKTTEESGEKSAVKSINFRKRARDARAASAAASKRRKYDLPPESEFLKNLVGEKTGKTRDIVDRDEKGWEKFTVKRGLSGSMNRRLIKRHKKIIKKEIDRDVVDISDVFIHGSRFFNHYHKGVFATVGSDGFLTQCPKPRVQFFKRLCDNYTPKKKKEDAGDEPSDKKPPPPRIDNELGKPFVEEFFRIFEASGLKKIDGKHRSGIVENMAVTYETNLKNNIQMHAKNLYVRSMVLLLRDEEGFEKEDGVKKIVYRAKCVWDMKKKFVLKKLATEATHQVFMEQRTKFKVCESKTKWWSTVPMLIQLQHDLLNAGLRTFEVFPQPKVRLHHVSYSRTGFQELWIRVTKLLNADGGFSKRVVRMKKAFETIQNKEEVERTAKEIERMEKFERAIPKYIEKSRDWEAKNPSIPLSTSMQQNLWPLNPRDYRRAGNAEVFTAWNALLDIHSFEKHLSTKRFGYHFTTDGVSICLTMERPTTENPEVSLPTLESIDTTGARLVGVDPGSRNPATIYWVSEQGQGHGHCMPRNLLSYRSQQYQRFRQIKRKTSKSLKAQAKQREDLEKEHNGVIVTSRSMNYELYTTHQMRSYAMSKEPHEKHRVLRRVGFDRHIRRPRAMNQIVRDFMLSEDNTKFKSDKFMSSYAQKARCEKNTLKHRLRQSEWHQMIKAGKLKALKEKYDYYKANNVTRRRAQKRGSRRKAKRQAARTKTDVEEQRPVIFFYGDAVEGILKRGTYRGQRFSHAMMISILRTKPQVQVVLVDEYLSSQTCSQCFESKGNFGELQLKQNRVGYCSKCNLFINRDTNAARNILVNNTSQPGKLIQLKKPSADGDWKEYQFWAVSPHSASI